MREKTSSYRDLEVWHKAKVLVLEIYGVTERFPKREWFGLASQMRRAALSILSNITEGNERRHRQEYLHFLNIARSSGSELEAQIEVSRGLKFLSEIESQDVLSRISEVQRMIRGLEKSLKATKVAESVPQHLASSI